MDFQTFLALAKQYGLPGAIGTLIGGFLTHFVESYRGRVKEIEYTVTHAQLGLSAQDAIHGSIEVHWQGQNLQNLFSSTVTVTNTTSQDYKDLTIAIFSQQPTFILSERVEIEGSSFIPERRKEFTDKLIVAPGAEPTEPQTFFFYHRREYIIPVMNRGAVANFRFLTTVPTNVAPLLFMETLQTGLKATFRIDENRLFGAPTRIGLRIGLVACALILLALHFYATRLWPVAVAMACGLAVIPIGAYIYRAFRAVKKIVLH